MQLVRTVPRGSTVRVESLQPTTRPLGSSPRARPWRKATDTEEGPTGANLPQLSLPCDNSVVTCRNTANALCPSRDRVLTLAYANAIPDGSGEYSLQKAVGVRAIRDRQHWSAFRLSHFLDVGLTVSLRLLIHKNLICFTSEAENLR